MSYQQNITEEVETLQIAAKLANNLASGMIIYLHGPLGAGKTTFTRGFLRALGLLEKVKSPTYTLIESYEINQKKIFHFDLYRLRDAEELIYIGVKDYFTSDSICLIEWPEKGGTFLPKPDLDCYIDMRGNARTIRIEACSPLGESILQKLS